jgi:hypothetical protein
MEPKTSHPVMMAPGASAATPAYCPGARDRLPPLDERIQPYDEDARIDIIDGERISAMANEEHAIPQTNLTVMLHAIASPGYHALVELTTRHDWDNDFSSDACVKRMGRDPQTGERYLEELAFEVANEQSLGILRKKAERMLRRGVRRVVGVLVKKRQLLVWTRGQEGPAILPEDGVLEDPCLRMPLPVRAILDAAEADDLLAQALIARDNRVIAQVRTEEREEGQREALQSGLLAVLTTRGFVVTEDVRARVAAATDLAVLQRWLVQAAVATGLAEVFREGG